MKKLIILCTFIVSMLLGYIAFKPEYEFMNLSGTQILCRLNKKTGRIDTFVLLGKGARFIGRDYYPIVITTPGIEKPADAPAPPSQPDIFDKLEEKHQK